MASERLDLTSPCCWLYLCCPPPVAAAALAAELQVPVEAATAILERFRLVPVELAPTQAAKGLESASAAGARLAKLNHLVRQELREILPGLGYADKGGSGESGEGL